MEFGKKGGVIPVGKIEVGVVRDILEPEFKNNADLRRKIRSGRTLNEECSYLVISHLEKSAQNGDSPDARQSAAMLADVGRSAVRQARIISERSNHSAGSR